MAGDELPLSSIAARIPLDEIDDLEGD